jgi:hypothetical protein
MAAEQFRGRNILRGIPQKNGCGVGIRRPCNSCLSNLGITYIRQYHYKATDENLLHYALSPAEVRQKFTTSSFLKSDNRL